GAVEGDIFHRTLSIDENSQFEGSSRRGENPTEASSSGAAKGPQKKPPKKNMGPAPSIPAPVMDGPNMPSQPPMWRYRGEVSTVALSNQQTDLAGKRLALLREVVPGLRRLAITVNVDLPVAVLEMGEILNAHELK